MCKLYLASESPRRKELLQRAGFVFTSCSHYFDESTHPSMEARELVSFLAEHKVKSAAEHIHEQEVDAQHILILSADTVVSIEGQVLEKPSDLEEAKKMLQLLSGKTHQVYTAVKLMVMKKDEVTANRTYRKLNEFSLNVCTEVSFYPLSSQEIEHYLNEEEVFDKAGAYGIQGKAAIFVKEIHGSYENVVGLPLGACRKLILATCLHYKLDLSSILKDKQT